MPALINKRLQFRLSFFYPVFILLTFLFGGLRHAVPPLMAQLFPPAPKLQSEPTLQIPVFY